MGVELKNWLLILKQRIERYSLDSRFDLSLEAADARI